MFRVEGKKENAMEGVDVGKLQISGVEKNGELLCGKGKNELEINIF